MERYRGHIIERYHSGPWHTTYEWRTEDFSDPHDPCGYEPTVAACKQAIDEYLDEICPACEGSGEVRVDPFDPRDLAKCPDCKGLGVG